MGKLGQNQEHKDKALKKTPVFYGKLPARASYYVRQSNAGVNQPVCLPYRAYQRNMIFRRFFKKDPLDDAGLIQLYKKTGDLKVLGELYDRYLHLIYGVCLKYLRDEEESKDATMQVFEKLIGELREHEVSNFKSWLHTLARNHCLMQLRSRKFKDGKNLERINWGEDMETDIGEHPDYEDREEDLQRMERGLDHLPPEQRQCLQLFYLDQKSYKEISDLTGYDFKQVKSYIQNGKRNLKIYLEKQP